MKKKTDGLLMEHTYEGNKLKKGVDKLMDMMEFLNCTQNEIQ